jgi:hypothetical protein
MPTESTCGRWVTDRPVPRESGAALAGSQTILDCHSEERSDEESGAVRRFAPQRHGTPSLPGFFAGPVLSIAEGYILSLPKGRESESLP